MSTRDHRSAKPRRRRAGKYIRPAGADRRSTQPASGPLAANTVPPGRRDAQRRRPKGSGSAVSEGVDQRLQKVLSAAGIASRRECEQYILEGRVEVDRRVVTQLGTKVDPARQEIRVDGTPLPQPKLVYYALYKPAGVVSTNRDPAGRPRVIDLVPNDPPVFAVGRLDAASEGLILVTNDGALANRLTHPRYGVEKTYQVQVAGIPDRDALETLRSGVRLAEGFVRPASIAVRRRQHKSTHLEIVLGEGRNREIRRLLARVGHKVMRLKRITIGTLRIGPMLPGQYRKLKSEEIYQLETVCRGRREGAEATASPRGRTASGKQRRRKTSRKPATVSVAGSIRIGGGGEATIIGGQPSKKRSPRPGKKAPGKKASSSTSSVGKRRTPPRKHR